MPINPSNFKQPFLKTTFLLKKPVLAKSELQLITQLLNSFANVANMVGRML